MGNKAFLLLAIVAALVLGAVAFFPEANRPLIDRTIPSIAPQTTANAAIEVAAGAVQTSVESEEVDQGGSTVDRNVQVEERLPPIQALPSVPGFNLRPAFSHLTSRLAAETRDPSWAVPMETQIREIIGDRFPMDGLEVECRMSSCGIVLVGEFVSLRGEQGEAYGLVMGLLAETLGFEQSWNTARTGAVGRQFTAVFLLDVEGRKVFVPEPEPPPKISALPGVSGFELDAQYSDLVVHPAQSLANEPEDLAWSTGMEARIVGELSTVLLGITVSQIEVVCRTTTCGVVIDYSPGPGVGPRLAQVTRHLVESLGFGLKGSIMGGDWSFMAIYLSAGDPPEDTIPR
jgi:hypothetical protein